jgi:plastocyanin
MARYGVGYTALLALALLAACGKDSGGGDQLIGPEADAIEASASGTRGSDRDSDGPGGGRFIAMRDDCDPRDPAWAPTGGCLLKRGNVTFAEFLAEITPPLSDLALSVVGHQGWRNDPSYLVIKTGKTVRVRNEGGRVHTFTEVARFGGGKVPNPALNRGLVTAPECPGSVDIQPGESVRVSGLAPGNHRFECCIHPWMRAIIKVKAN